MSSEKNGVDTCPAGPPKASIVSWMLALTFILFTVAFKLAVVCWGGFDLSFDEAYYWHWSKNLDWCYFSKGPGIALMIRATTALLGDTEFAIRAGAILCSTTTVVLLYFWSRQLFQCGTTALLTIILFCSAPFLMGLGMLSTIDSPMILCWTTATVLLWHAVRRRHIGWWFALGLAVAVGVQFKFTMLFFLFAVAVVAIRNKEWGRALISVAVVALSLLPILAWNIGNEWITLDHTVKKASTRGNEWTITAQHLLPSIGQQLGVMSPLIALGVGVAAVCLGRDVLRPTSKGTTMPVSEAFFLLAVASPIVVFYGVLSFHRTIEANWLAPAYVTLVPAAAYYWIRPFTRGQRWSLGIALALGWMLQAPLLAGDALYDSSIPAWLERAGIPFRPSLDVTNRVRGWKELGRWAAAEGEKWEKKTGRPVFFLTDHYSLAAYVGFYGQKPDSVFTIPSPAPQNQFDLWATTGRRPPTGGVGICVYDLLKAGRLADPFFAGPHEDYLGGEFIRGNIPVRKYLFRVFLDYQGNERWGDLAREVSGPMAR